MVYLQFCRPCRSLFGDIGFCLVNLYLINVFIFRGSVIGNHLFSYRMPPIFSATFIPISNSVLKLISPDVIQHIVSTALICVLL